MAVLQEKISKALIDALKAKEELRVSVLRMLKSALHNAAIAKNKPLTEEDELKIVRQELKKRIDASEGFISGGREESAAREKAEAGILQQYLPAELSDEDLFVIIRKHIEANGFLAKDFGSAMKAVMAEAGARADGARVSKMLKEKLPR